MCMLYVHLGERILSGTSTFTAEQINLYAICIYHCISHSVLIQSGEDISHPSKATLLRR